MTLVQSQVDLGGEHLDNPPAGNAETTSCEMRISLRAVIVELAGDTAVGRGCCAGRWRRAGKV